MSRSTHFLGALLVVGALPAATTGGWRSQVYFEPNLGQAAAEIQFIARAGDSTALINASGVMIERGGSRVRMNLADARPVVPEPVDRLESATHYLTGNQRSRWRRDIPHYAKLRYPGVLPGIDATLHGAGGNLEYDFDLAPGADPHSILVSHDAGTSLRILSTGDLEVSFRGGRMLHKKPIAWQTFDGVRRAVPVRFRLRGTRQFGFDLGSFDRTQPLHIDPVIEFATYLGAGGMDIPSKGIGMDPQGNIVIAGSTESTLPTTAGVLRPTAPGRVDGFVAKLDPTGARLLFLTYFGGNDADVILALATDATGAIYLTGGTNSFDFPVMGPLGPTHGACNSISPCRDVFVAKLSADGRNLVYSGLLGGPTEEYGTGIAVDSSGNAYITGPTKSPTFPNTVGIQQGIRPGHCAVVGSNSDGCPDVFVTKIGATGANIVYSAVFGTAVNGPPLARPFADSRGEDVSTAIAVDRNGSAYVTGDTFLGPDLPSFPATPGSLMNIQPRTDFGARVLFVVKLRPDGAIGYSALVGGAGSQSIAVDAAGAAYVLGLGAADFPTTAGAFQRAISGGGRDAVVFKINPAGTAMDYSTYLGGTGVEGGLNSIITTSIPIPPAAHQFSAIQVDSTGAAYITSSTTSTNFPTTADGTQRTFGGLRDAFLAKLNPAGSALLFSTYLGGLAEDVGSGLTIDAAGKVILSGFTTSMNFPVTNGAFQPARSGFFDVFIARFDLSPAAPGPVVGTHANVSAASYQSTAFAPESFVSAFGTNLAGSTAAAAAQPLPTTLGGASVRVTDSAGLARNAGLQYASPALVNYVMPPGTAAGNAVVTITNGAATSQQTVRIDPVAPGIFTANADGQGVPAAYIVRARGSIVTNEFVFTFDNAQSRFVPAAIEFDPAVDQLVLVLFGTGIRGRTSLANMSALIGGETVNPVFASAQGEFAGLDQVNLPIPAALAGRGIVIVNLTVDGRQANAVSIRLQ